MPDPKPLVLNTAVGGLILMAIPKVIPARSGSDRAAISVGGGETHGLG